MGIKYRPEIDGLRTIAVLAVIIYHAEIYIGKYQLLKGGFLGVDVFFVISGFLITSIILDEYRRTGKFCIANFYERRARRILPALFTVILVSLPFAWNLLLPLQLTDYSKSILSSLVFGSNIYWDQTLQQYGAESALLKPFLHTWSLAVEEQYYIVFPLILVAFSRWLKNRITMMVLAAGSLCSLLLAEKMTTYDASFSFYMLPTRLWELLCGAVLAYTLALYPPQRSNALLNRFVPIVGLFLIVHSMIFIEFGSSHPGFVTLIPLLGTVLIIWFANETDLVTSVLSTKVFVGIGLISYSLYLWHYPIFAFGRYLDPRPSWADKLQWILLAFSLSLAIYLWIEKPFRDRKRVRRKTLILYLATTFVTISSINLFWLINDGFDSRLGYLNSVLKESSRIWVTKDNKRCHAGGMRRKPAFQLSESCVFTDYPDAKYIIVVGDSHAGAISHSLRQLANANAYNFVQLTSFGCYHIKGIHQKGVCGQRANQLATYLEQYPDSIVVYCARVPLLLEMEKFINAEGEKEDNYKAVQADFVEQHFPVRAEALVDTLNELKSISEKLVIVYPIPEQGFHVKDKLFRNFRLVKNKEMLPIITTSYDRFKERVRRSYETLDSVAGANVFRVYPERVFCDEETGRCIVSKKDKIFFANDNHVSPLGAGLIATQIAEVLRLKVIPFKQSADKM